MKTKMKKGKSVIQSILDPVTSKEKGEERDQECCRWGWGRSNTQYYVNENLVCIQYHQDQMLLQFTVLKYYNCSNFAQNQNS